MAATEIRPAFDADLQPIGYELALELLAAASPQPALRSEPDMFGWELAPQSPACPITGFDPGST